MRRSLFAGLCILFSCFIVRAQKSNQMSVQLSSSQVELGYQHKFSDERVWAGPFIGLGNKDIDSRFNDFFAGLGTGIDLYSSGRNRVGICANAGFYFPSNSYYRAVTPFAGAGLRYSRFFGAKQNHGLIIEGGYVYGKRYYRQDYLSESINVSFTGTFRLPPLMFSVGYGFCF